MRALITALHRSLLILPLLCGGAGAANASSLAMANVAALGAGYSASDAPLGAPTELQIDLRGEVGARCRLTSPPILAGQLDFTRSGDTEAPFGLDCNSPFTLRVRSGQGGFIAETQQPGITPVVPYEISVDVDTDQGANALGWCRADALSDRQAGACAFGGSAGWSSGQAVAINRAGTMRLRWDAPSDAKAMLFGRYRDTIVVEVAVRS